MPIFDMLKKWFAGMFGGNGPEPNTAPYSAEPNLLYNIRWSESTEGIEECKRGDPEFINCYLIDINPAALAADTVSVIDFNGNTFTVAKTYSRKPVMGADTVSVTYFTPFTFNFTVPNRYDTRQGANWESNRIWESNSNSIDIMNFGVKTGPSSGPNSILGHYKFRYVSKLQK